MRGSAAFRSGVAPGSALAGPWVKNDLWRRARAVPSLDLRFAESKSLVDATTGANLVTFNRASSGTYVDSQGVIKTATTNEPRFDHNPTTGESLGLLVEEQRTNSIRNNTMVSAVAGTPGTLPTNWSASLGGGFSREIVGTGTINGINYIDLRIFGTATNTNLALNLAFEGNFIAAASGQSWTESMWVSMVAGSTTGINYIQPNITERSAAPADLAYNNGASFVSTISSFLRRTYAVTLGNASTAYAVPGLWMGHTGVGASVDITLRIGLPQLEQGAFATSVIPTTTATVTRSADVASISGSNFSSWYRQDEGTLYGQGVIANTSSNRFLVAASDATLQEEIALYENTAFNSLVTDNNVAQGNSFGGTVTAGSELRHGFSYKLNDLQGYGSGIALSADTSATLPTVDRLTIGSRVNSTFWLNGTIRRLTYWPQRLPNSTLQAITQP